MNEEICRICLSKHELRLIFLNNEQSEEYSTVLSLTTGSHIKPHDGLPQHICRECIDAVDNALKLRKKTQISEAELLQLGYQRTKPEKQICLEQEEKDISVITANSGILDELPADSFDFDGFKVEVELDHITQDGDNRSDSTRDDIDNNKPQKKSRKKERREQYLSLVEGELDPKGPVKCKICKTTVSKWTCFVNHAKKHLGFKFICEFCGKSFISSNQLKRHCRSFHGLERDLKCRHCNYLALDNAQLMVHERREHTGERPYVCDVCAAAYYSRKCLLQHIESHRTTASVQCDKCPMSFKSRRHLAKHRYGAHSDKRRARRKERREAAKLVTI